MNITIHTNFLSLMGMLNNYINLSKISPKNATISDCFSNISYLYKYVKSYELVIADMTVGIVEKNSNPLKAIWKRMSYFQV